MTMLSEAKLVFLDVETTGLSPAMGNRDQPLRPSSWIGLRLHNNGGSQPMRPFALDDVEELVRREYMLIEVFGVTCSGCNGDGTQTTTYTVPGTEPTMIAGSATDHVGNASASTNPVPDEVRTTASTCGGCSGSGEVRCHECGGDGAVGCGSCQATGRITACRSVTYEIVTTLEWPLSENPQDLKDWLQARDPGELLQTEMRHEGQRFSGTACVQSARSLEKDRIRYGLHCVDETHAGCNLAKGLWQITMAVQRQQLRRLAGKG